MPLEVELMKSGVSRAEAVYAALRDWLHSGAYARGERVREEEVARSLGVSRTPVREALARLESRGLLVASSSGLTVATLSRSQVIELYSLREVLEGAAARFAAQHASSGDVDSLRALNAAFAAAGGDAAKQSRINRSFHETIYEAAHNQYLIRQLQDLNDFLSLLPKTIFSVEGRSAVTLGEHDAIIDAIERHDADGAELAARRHIKMAQQARLTLMVDSR